TQLPPWKRLSSPVGRLLVGSAAPTFTERKRTANGVKGGSQRVGWLTALIFAMVIATGMTATVGASFFITNWQAQRQISGRPREWFSAEQLYRRRQGLAHLLAP